MTCKGLNSQALTPTMSPSFRSLQPHRPPRKLAKLMANGRAFVLAGLSLWNTLHILCDQLLLMIRSQLNWQLRELLPATLTHIHTGLLGLAVGRDTMVTSYCFSSNKKKAYSGSVVYPTVCIKYVPRKTYWLNACITISSQASISWEQLWL